MTTPVTTFLLVRAPEWVSYASLAGSSLALLVSATAAYIAYRSYQASGPRLRLKVGQVHVKPGSGSAMTTLTVTNRGRAEVTIDGFKITPYGHRRPVLVVPDVEDGPSLPARLKASSTETWKANILPVARTYEKALQDGTIKPYSSWPSLFYIAVSAGNGNHVRDRARKIDAARVIARAFPPDTTVL